MPLTSVIQNPVEDIHHEEGEDWPKGTYPEPNHFHQDRALDRKRVECVGESRHCLSAAIGKCTDESSDSPPDEERTHPGRRVRDAAFFRQLVPASSQNGHCHLTLSGRKAEQRELPGAGQTRSLVHDLGVGSSVNQGPKLQVA